MKIAGTHALVTGAASGLGLATVYSVIQKHRGHVTVESTLGVVEHA